MANVVIKRLTGWASITAMVIVIGVAFQLAACAFLINTHVDDLKVSRISLVSADEAPHSTRGWPPQGDKKVILITLTTDYDIASAATTRELFNLHADITFCGTSDKVAWSGVYETGRRVGDLPGAESERRSEPHLPRTFQVWLDYRTLLHRTGGGYIDYDLAQRPRDLCISIGGAPYMAMGIGLVTNTVIVRKDEIAAILKDQHAQAP